MDITKAFDRVWHNGLLYKLYKMKAPEYLIKIIEGFLKERQLQIKINSSLSNTFTPEKGLPQGSPLSPILYNIFCHDMYNYDFNDKHYINPKQYIFQFCDDTTLVTHNTTLKNTIEKLQQLSNKTLLWMKKWQISPNPNKTQFTIFGHRITESSPTIKMIQQNITPTPTVKYLGITIDKKLNFKKHTQNSKNQIITRAKHFRALTYKREGINLKTATTIYKMICRPIIEYGHHIFINARKPTLKTIEVAERSSLRSITKIRHPRNPLHNPSNEMLYKNTKIEPIQQRMLRLSSKFANSPHNFEILHHCTIEENTISRRKYPETILITKLKQLIEN